MPPQIIIGVPLLAPPPLCPLQGCTNVSRRICGGCGSVLLGASPAPSGGGGSTEGLPWGSQSLLRWVRGLDPKNGAGGRGNVNTGGAAPLKGAGGDLESRGGHPKN